MLDAERKLAQWLEPPHAIRPVAPLIVACVADDIIEAVRALALAPASLRLERDINEALTASRREPVTLAVLDASLIAPLERSELRLTLPDIVARFAVPVALYCRIDPRIIKALPGLPRHVRVIVAGDEEAPSQLQAILRSAVTSRIGREILMGMTERLEMLPRRLSEVLEDLFQEPLRYSTLAQIVSASSLPRRTVDRSLNRAGLASMRPLWHVARMALLHTELQLGTVRQVALRFGRESDRVMAREVARVTAMTPRAFRATQAIDVIRLLSAACVRSSATRAGQVAIAGPLTHSLCIPESLSASRPSSH